MSNENRGFRSRLPQTKQGWLKLGCLSIVGFVLLLVGLFSLISATAPYKVRCSGSGFYTGSFFDRDDAEEAYQEQTSEGLQCEREYKEGR